MKLCNGCGECCKEMPCSLAIRIHGTTFKKCPELKWDGTRYWCNIVQLRRMYTEFNKFCQKSEGGM